MGEEDYYRPLTAGTMVYYPTAEGGSGPLMRVEEDFDPAAQQDEGAPDMCVLASCVSYYDRPATQKHYDLPVFDRYLSARAYRYATDKLWVVDHRVQKVARADLFPAPKGLPTYERWEFDWRAANREIRASRRMLGLDEDESWVLLDSPGTPGVATPPDSPLANPLAGEQMEHLHAALDDLSLTGRLTDDAERAGRRLAASLVVGTEAPVDSAALLAARMQEDGAPGDEAESPALIDLSSPGAYSPGPVSTALRRARESTVRMENMYTMVKCAACDAPVGDGASVSYRGRVIHDTLSCRLRCASKHEGHAVSVPLSVQSRGGGAQTIARAPAGGEAPCHPCSGDVSPTTAQAVAGGQGANAVAQARGDDQYNPMRMTAIRSCLDGLCTRVCKHERTLCVEAGCERGLHVAECGGFGKGYALGARLRCAYCRVKQMAPAREASESLMRLAMETMVSELSTGAETTASGFADIDALEKRFVAELGVASLRLPRHCKESFKAFLTWCYRHGGRALSMEALWRQLNLLLTKLELVDFTKMGDVEALYKKLKGSTGAKSAPATVCTRRMRRLLLEQVIPSDSGSWFLVRRDRLAYGATSLGGPRIGEAVDHGQGHGLSATHAYIVTDRSTQREVVEMYLESSKTGFGRFIDVAARNTSGVNLAVYLRDYWAEMKWPIEHRRVGDFTIEAPNVFVLRVSLLGMEQNDVDRMMVALKRSECSSAVANAQSTAAYAKQRVAATGPGSMTKKYVNVALAGGGDRSLVYLKKELERIGFTGMCSIVDAPLIVATTPKGGPSLMPLSSGSTFARTGKYLAEACRLANLDATDLDPDLEISVSQIASSGSAMAVADTACAARWSNHSFRRMVDKHVRQYAEKHGTKPEIINQKLGWELKSMSRDMQLKYDSEDLRKRMESANITAEL